MSTSSKDLRALDRKRLGAFRRLAERGWSEQTVHRTARPWNPEISRSRGQCGVTAMWLQDLLRADDVTTTYCIGELREPASTVEYHCWLEYGEAGSPDALVIDLTGDQARGITSDVVVARRSELERVGINYKVVRKPTRGELEESNLADRAELLAAAVRE